MIYDELLDKINAIIPDLEVIKKYWNQSGSESLYQKLKTQAEHPDFWKHLQQAAILKKLQQAQSQRNQYHSILESYQELADLINLFKDDEKELTKLDKPINQLAKVIQQCKVSLLLNKPEDSANCFLTINAGAGGTESQDWANMLLRMYVRFCEQTNLSAQIIDIQPGEEAGIKSATIYSTGKNAYGLLKGEEGVHRLVRISPFDSSKRRHTSFAAISLTPEQPETEITIEPHDLRIDTYRAGGAGGQHVNKTDSAVRITHLPTNIVVQCQNERSQLQNRETAMKMLKAKLIQKKNEEEEAKLKMVERKKIEWGSQIRSYVLHPYKMVKDHRTKKESPQPEHVLDGDLMPFIENYLLHSS